MREIKFRAWDGDKSLGHQMHGYWYRKADYHPLATGRGYVLEHRLVMENHIGDYLPKGAVIHHVNKDRSDNRIENLEYIPEQSRHAKDHDNGKRNVNGQFVTTDPTFNEIKFRLFNKDAKQSQIYSLAKLISTTFRNSKFEFRGRFTGLKDKNDKEIYEGDIVNYSVKKRFCECHSEQELTAATQFCPSCGKKVDLSDFITIATVEYSKAGFALFYTDKRDNSYRWSYHAAEHFIAWIEIIGNIYSNPELLKR